MDRYLVISSDCHAGLPPQRYRDYLDAKYHQAFDAALPIQLELIQKAAKRFLVADINQEWRKGRDSDLSGAWDHDARVRVLDGDGIAGEIIFPDGITEMNTPPFGAGLSLPTEQIVPELQWAVARAHNRWLAELCQMAPERRVGVALVPALWDVDEAVREVRRCARVSAPAESHPRVRAAPRWRRDPSLPDPGVDALGFSCLLRARRVETASGVERQGMDECGRRAGRPQRAGAGEGRQSRLGAAGGRRSARGRGQTAPRLEPRSPVDSRRPPGG